VGFHGAGSADLADAAQVGIATSTAISHAQPRQVRIKWIMRVQTEWTWIADLSSQRNPISQRLQIMALKPFKAA
jgi:hypothetical protein